MRYVLLIECSFTSGAIAMRPAALETENKKPKTESNAPGSEPTIGADEMKKIEELGKNVGDKELEIKVKKKGEQNKPDDPKDVKIMVNKEGTKLKTQ